MVLRVNQKPIIENLRHYPAETVETVRELLAAGAAARVDRHRKDFYEIEDGARVYYIHISPITGKVILLGTWDKTPEPKMVTPTTCAA